MKYIKEFLSRYGMTNIMVLTFGSLIAQLVNFICQPIVTRLYTVESFGIQSIILSVVSILLPISTLQYHMGIIISKSDEEANEVSALSFYLIMFISMLTFVGLIIFNKVNPSFFADTGLWIYASVPILFVSGIIQVVDSYNNRFGQYKLMATVSLRRAIASNIARIFFGILKLGSSGLIISQFISLIFGIKKQANYIIKNINDIFNTSFQKMKLIAIKYKAQPMYSMPGLFVANYSYSILPIFVTTLYGIEEVGFFSLSVMLLGTPLTLISNNVAKVFLKESSEEINKTGNFKHTFNKFSILLIIISFIGFTILWIISEPLFSILYGEKWLRSGIFVKVFIPLYASRFVVTPLMHGFIVSSKQGLKLLLQSFFILSAVLIYYIATVKQLPIEVFLRMINFSYTCVYVLLFFVLYSVSKKR